MPKKVIFFLLLFFVCLFVTQQLETRLISLPPAIYHLLSKFVFFSCTREKKRSLIKGSSPKRRYLYIKHARQVWTVVMCRGGCFWHSQVTEHRVIPPRIKSLIPLAGWAIIFLLRLHWLRTRTISPSSPPPTSASMCLLFSAHLSPLSCSFFFGHHSDLRAVRNLLGVWRTTTHWFVISIELNFVHFFLFLFCRSLSYSRWLCGRHLLFCSDSGRHPPTLD